MVYATIERKGLLRKEEFTVCLSLSDTEGLIINSPNWKGHSLEFQRNLKKKIRESITLSDDDIKNQCILERTFVVNQIRKDIRGKIFNGFGAVTDIMVYNSDNKLQV